MIVAAVPVVAPAHAKEPADSLRVATFNVNLSRRGPGLLLRDLLRGDPAAESVARIVATVAPDVLLLTKFDHDHGLVALNAFADLVRAQGHDLPHLFAVRPNSGRQTGMDMIGDGRVNTPDDAQGYGAFAGVAGMALMSRLPVDHAEVRDFSAFLWRDLPGARLPQQAGQPFPSAQVFDVQRLSTTAHWEVPLILPDGGVLRVLGWYASPPVFGGREGRNRLRNHDETMFWVYLLDGVLGMAPPQEPFVLMGDSNLDPYDGDGIHDAMRRLLAHPAVQDPAPRSAGALAAHVAGDRPRRGDPALHTTEWTREGGPGNLRVDYVLPSVGLPVLDAGVFWPEPGDPEHAMLGDPADPPTRHRLVWVDIALP